MNPHTEAGKYAEPSMYQQYQTRGEMQGKTAWASYEQKHFQQVSEDDYDSDENYHTYGNMRSAVHDMRKSSHNQREIYNPNMRRVVRSTSHSSQGETWLRDDFTSPSKSNRLARSPPQIINGEVRYSRRSNTRSPTQSPSTRYRRHSSKSRTSNKYRSKKHHRSEKKHHRHRSSSYSSEDSESSSDDSRTSDDSYFPV